MTKIVFGHRRAEYIFGHCVAKKNSLGQRQANSEEISYCLLNLSIFNEKQTKTTIEPVCYKKRSKIVTYQLLVWRIRAV